MASLLVLADSVLLDAVSLLALLAAGLDVPPLVVFVALPPPLKSVAYQPVPFN